MPVAYLLLTAISNGRRYNSLAVCPSNHTHSLLIRFTSISLNAKCFIYSPSSSACKICLAESSPGAGISRSDLHFTPLTWSFDPPQSVMTIPSYPHSFHTAGFVSYSLLVLTGRFSRSSDYIRHFSKNLVLVPNCTYLGIKEQPTYKVSCEDIAEKSNISFNVLLNCVGRKASVTACILFSNNSSFLIMINSSAVFLASSKASCCLP